MARSAEVVASQLRREIFDGERPSGSPLREVALSGHFDVSRRTVRESLLLLAGEGLVIHRHNQGASVRSFTLEEVRDLYRVRRVLEVEGARCATLVTEQQLNRVSLAMGGIRDTAVGGLRNPALAQADVDFHAAIIALIGSPSIDNFYRQSGTQTAYAILQLQRHDYSEQVDVLGTVREHQAIHDAVIERRVLDAQRAILEHIDRHEQSFLRALAGGAGTGTGTGKIPSESAASREDSGESAAPLTASLSH